MKRILSSQFDGQSQSQTKVFPAWTRSLLKLVFNLVYFFNLIVCTLVGDGFIDKNRWSNHNKGQKNVMNKIVIDYFSEIQFNLNFKWSMFFYIIFFYACTSSNSYMFEFNCFKFLTTNKLYQHWIEIVSLIAKLQSKSPATIWSNMCTLNLLLK